MAKDGKRMLMPRRRFPEFREMWVEIPLKEFASVVSERAGTMPCTPYTVTSGIGLISQEEKLGRTIAGNSLKTYTLLKKNDFAYNKSATKAFPEGYIARYVDGENAAVPSSIFTCFRVDDRKIDPAYLDFLFVGNLHGKWLRKFLTVGARAHGSLNVSDDDLMALPVPVPSGSSSFAEQRKIVDCLTSLDELIAAQGRKVEVLKDHKKGLTQQLFPREGETLPRCRFPEFRKAPEWEEKKGGSLFGNRIQKGEKGLPIYSVTMHDGMVRRDSFDRNFYDIEDAAGNKKACKNDISYNMMRMWQGALGVAPEDCLVSPAYIVLSPQKDVVSQFFEYLFKLPSSVETLASHSRGLTKDRLRLYYDDFSRIPLRCPEPAEQNRIADCLTAIDDQIATEADKLAALKTLKRGLMQQLFPSPEVD